MKWHSPTPPPPPDPQATGSVKVIVFDGNDFHCPVRCVGGRWFSLKSELFNVVKWAAIPDKWMEAKS